METIFSILVFLLVILIVYLAALVTYHTIRSDYFESNQKAMIVVIAWLIPIIGPAFIITVLNQDKPSVRKPGIPFLDYLFLTAVFTQNLPPDSGVPIESGNEVSGIDGGGEGGD